MRDSVTIDGVTLTRKQIEEAHAKLGEPEAFHPGDVVITTRGNARLVLSKHDDWLQRASAYAQRHNRSVVSEQDGVIFINSQDDRRVGTFRQIVAFYRQHHPEAKS